MTTMIASSSSSSSKKQQLQEQQQQLYYEIEKWCQYHIHNGSAFLFEGHDIFVSTLKKKSDEIRSRGSGGDGVGSGGGGGGGRIETTSGDFQIQSPPLSSSSPWPLDSLHSFFCSLHTKHVKNAAYRLKTNISQYLDGYRNGQSIVAMAKQSNIPPYLMCRQIVEHICDLRRKKEEEEEEEAIDGEENNNNNNNHNHNNITDGSTDTAGKKHKKNTINEEYNSKDYKKRLTMAMRNPIGVLNDRSMILTEFQDTEENWTTHSSITPNTTTDNTSITATTTRIAHEVATALEADALCGPTQDRSKHFVGIEFEVVLERQLTELGIPFEAEAHLRELGTSKTPDVVLLVPVAFQVGSEWKVVNWIDSKAMFGDAESHRTSVYPQAKTYIHRYGPGMILYWFGHAPMAMLEAETGQNDDLFVCSRKLPDSFMWPTGDVETAASRSTNEDTTNRRL